MLTLQCWCWWPTLSGVNPQNDLQVENLCSGLQRFPETTAVRANTRPESSCNAEFARRFLFTVYIFFSVIFMTDSNSIQLKPMEGSQLVLDLWPSSAKPAKFKILVSLDKEKTKSQTNQLWKIRTGKHISDFFSFWILSWISFAQLRI